MHGGDLHSGEIPLNINWNVLHDTVMFINVEIEKLVAIKFDFKSI